jgi:hypothetical protein
MNRRTKKAGKAIASGAFGCVFRPPLRCKGETNRPGTSDKPMISKLMFKKYALEEYTIIENVKKIVKDIPNYSDYFVIDDITMCEPGELDDEDMENAVKECGFPLVLAGNETTISSNKLSRTSVITAPDMGKDIYKSFEQMSKDYDNYKGSDKFSLVSKNLKKINTQIFKLLKNGVAPMIYKDIYHNDLKDQNIMTSYSSLEDVKNNFNYAKMIDFGLLKQITQNSDSEHISNSLMNILSLNSPIYNVVFDEEMLDAFTQVFEDIYPNLNTRYDDMMKDLQTGILQQKIYKAFIPIVESKLKDREHWPFLQDIYRWCEFNYSGKSRSQFILCVVIILVTAFFQIISITREDQNVKYNIKHYFNAVVRHNIDAVGVVSSYYNICLTLLSKQEIKENMKDVVTAYADLLYEYMFSTKYVSQAISIPELVKKIENINSLLSKYDNRNSNGNNNSNTNTNKIISLLTHKATISTPKSRTMRTKTATPKSSRPKSRTKTATPKSSRPKSSRPKSRTMKTKTATPKSITRRTSLKSRSPNSLKTMITLKNNRCPPGYVRHPNKKNKCLSKKKLGITTSMTKNKRRYTTHMMSSKNPSKYGF